jgi:acyl carrier protein
MGGALEKLQEVFRSVFDDEELVINKETSAKDIPNWDSLMHVTLIVSVEKAFNVHFASSEVVQLKNVGDLLALIKAKGRNEKG